MKYLILVMIFSVSAGAQTSQEAATVGGLAKIEKDFAAKTEELKKLKEKMKDADTAVERLKVNIKDNRDKFIRLNAATGDLAEDDKTFMADYRRTLNEVKDAEKNANKQWADTQKSIEQLEKELKELSSAKIKDKGILDITRSSYQNQINRGEHLATKFDVVQSRLENLGLKLESVKTKYDQSLLGYYIREKMMEQMNSDLFCEVARSCGDGSKKTKATKPSNDQPVRKNVTYGDMDKIFKGLNQPKTQNATQNSAK